MLNRPQWGLLWEVQNEASNDRGPCVIQDWEAKHLGGRPLSYFSVALLLLLVAFLGDHLKAKIVVHRVLVVALESNPLIPYKLLGGIFKDADCATNLVLVLQANKSRNAF